MPLNMIRKSAIVNGLREAFPDSLGAMYTEDDADVHQADSTEQIIQQEIKQNANSEILDIEDTPKEQETVQEAVYQEVPEQEQVHVTPQEEPIQQQNLFEGPGF